MSRSVRYFVFVSFTAIAAFAAVGYTTSAPTDWPFASGTTFRDVTNLSGPFGSLIAFVFFGLVGQLFAWFLPASLLVWGVGVAVERSIVATQILVKTFVIAVLLNAFFALIPFTSQSTVLKGSLGTSIARVVSSALGEIGATILLITLLLLTFLTQVRFLGRAAVSGLRRTTAVFPAAAHAIRAVAGWSVRTGLRASAAHRAQKRIEEEPVVSSTPERRAKSLVDAPWIDAEVEPPPPESRTARVISTRPRTSPRPPVRREKPTPDKVGVSIDDAVLPPLSILGTGEGTTALFPKDKLENWSEVLEDKLSNYGIEGSVTAVNQGPLVTTFEFEPAPGVKIKDIVSRSDDLALAMRARSLRLIAPIPGRAVVGIEIPNPEQETVYLHDVLKEIPERLRYSGIMVALGVDAVGKPFHMNLCTAPHLLMAGTTGSGKSVSLNVILASILFQYRPTDVQLFLIDPKMVELSMYDGIPHLVHPVITDPREAAKVFNFLISEMERRNELFRQHGVKNIESFNSKIALGKTESLEAVEKLPYIVLVVDELGDLVLTKGVDIESLLSRLSNMARAVGIHMIVATQRPSVDVIVGKTKANFPTRIAFRVASRVDSRTILDAIGADKLLGRGDMLLVDAKHSEALRLHGAWMSEEESEELINHWKQYQFEESHLDLNAGASRGGMVDDDRDPYFEDAIDIILQYRQGSTSLLQRKLHIGYARAARLLDQLEAAGYVGPPDGSKPREVLIRDRSDIDASSVGSGLDREFLDR